MQIILNQYLPLEKLKRSQLDLDLLGHEAKKLTQTKSEDKKSDEKKMWATRPEAKRLSVKSVAAKSWC